MDPRTTERNVAIVRRFVTEVLNGGRPTSASVLVASEPLERRIATLRASFSDLRLRIVKIVADESLVAVHLVGTGTHSGPFQGSSPTGRAWAASCTAIYEIVDGRIVDFWVTWDMLGIAEQLGIVRRSESASA